MNPLDRDSPASQAGAESQNGPSANDAPLASATEPGLSGRRTVLVVENDDQGRRLIEQILAFSDYACLSAANGQAALDLLDHARVDLVLMDISMPVLDGYQTVERMRRRLEHATTPIVAVSGHTGGEERALALRSGFSEYLSKPYRPKELLQLIDRLLSNAARREDGSDE
jgi:CheY-like chemotaxis protein